MTVGSTLLGKSTIECQLSSTNLLRHDSFTHNANTQHSLAFEKASLLFNLACINSHIGAEADDLRVAYNRFKDAGGIFTFIIGNFLHAPSTDLSQETVKALCKLMIAQAQESFVERLLTESSSSPMLAKLAKAASNLFKAAAESLQSVSTDKNWGEKAWHQYCSVKGKYYLSVAHEQSAKNCENSGKYGDAIAHLQAAVSNIQDVYKSSIPSQYSAFFDVVSTLQESMKEKISKLEKENDLIYHCTVPSVASVGDIPAVEAATPTPMNELYKDGQELAKLIGKELFEKVIPLSVHQQTSLYSEEKASMLRAEGEKIEIANEELSSALEFLDLPNALRTLRTDGSDILSLSKSQGIDSRVNDWAAQISAESSTKTSSFSNLDGVKRSIYEKMKNAERLLQEEEKSYENAKSEFRQHWAQAPSATMNSGLLADVSRIKHDLSNASTSDEKLKNLIGVCEGDIQILKLGPNSAQLKSLFENIQVPSASGTNVNLLDLDQSSDSYVDSLLDQTEDLLKSLQKLRDDRNTSFTEFKDIVHKDDISGILVLNNKNPDLQDSLFKSELAKFQPHKTQFEDSIQYQQNLLKELTMNWKKVLEDKAVRSKTVQKEELKNKRIALVDRFQRAFDSWKDSEQGLNKAFEFYEKLLAFTKSTLANAEDFVSNRNEEASMLKATASSSASQSSQELLREQLSRLSVGSQSHTPSYSSATSTDRSTGYQPLAPSSGYQSSAPPAGYQSSVPSTGHQTSAPSAGYQATAPSTGYQTSAPSAPSPGYQSSAPPASSTFSPSSTTAVPASSGWGDLSFLEKAPAPPPKPSVSSPSPSFTQPQYSNYSNYSQPPSQQASQQPPQQPPQQAPQHVQQQYSYPSAPSQPSQPTSYSYQQQPPIQSYQTPPTQSLQHQAPQAPYQSPPYQSPAQQQPSYQTYQPQYQQPPQQYDAYQQQPPQPQQYQTQNTPQSTGGSFGYGQAPPQKDYSRMPPPPPPSNQGQNYYRQY